MLSKYAVYALKAKVNSALDPFQYAYRQWQGKDDVINSITHMAILSA